MVSGQLSTTFDLTTPHTHACVCGNTTKQQQTCTHVKHVLRRSCVAAKLRKYLRKIQNQRQPNKRSGQSHQRNERAVAAVPGCGTECGGREGTCSSGSLLRPFHYFFFPYTQRHKAHVPARAKLLLSPVFWRNGMMSERKSQCTHTLRRYQA